MIMKPSYRQLAAIYGLIGLVIAWLILPAGWMVLTAIKPPALVATNPPTFLFEPTTANFAAVLGAKEIGGSFVDTVVISVATTVLAVTVGSFAAYSIARFSTGGVGVFFFLIFVQAMPSVVLGLPFFVMFRQLGLYDTIPGLVLAYSTVSLPFAIWLLVAFFDDIPRELEEAALVDGCSRWGALFRVVMPMARPGLAVAGILTFMGAWNQFFFALVLAGQNVRTLPQVASNYISTYTLDWGKVAAAGVLLLIPPIIVVLAMERHIVRGLTFGAVKA
jgi:multiple sugar transport system permease protein